MAIIKETSNNTSVGEDVAKLETSPTASSNVNGTATLKISLAVPPRH